VTQYDLHYRFRPSGQADVARAFQSISTSAAKAATAEQRSQARTEAAAEKAAGAKERAAAKAARAAEKEADKAARAEQKHTATVEREAKKRADIEIRESKRAAASQAREQRAAAKSQERASQRRAASLGRLTDDAKGMALGGAATVGAAGLGIVGAAARKEFRTRSMARDLSVSARGSGQRAVDPSVLTKEAHDVAAKNPGISADGVLSGMRAFVTKTGDLATARKLSGTMATVASATGADPSEIGDAMADMSKKFDIKSVEGMQQAMAVLVEQGKKGSFELKDLAAQLPKVGAAAQRFGLDKGHKGIAKLGGLLQISREATGSSEQASSALEATFRQLVSKSGDLKDAGVNVFDKGGNARDIEDVLVESISKVGGKDMEKKKVGLQKIFGEEGIRAISPLIDTFATAVKEGTDPVKALRDRLGEAIGATGGWSDVVQDATLRQQDESAKLTAAWDALGAKVGEAVLPHLTGMADAVLKNRSALDALAGTVGVLAEGFESLAKALGIVTGAGDAEKGVADADAALADFDARVAARQASDPDADTNENGLTAAEQAESSKLEAASKSARTRRDALSGAVNGGLSDDAYAAEYERLGKEDAPSDTDRVMNAIVQSMTGGAIGGIDGFMNPGENAKQTALREAQGRGTGETPTDPGANADLARLLGTAGPELLKAAGELAKAAGLMPKGGGKGDPLGGGTP
jgi:hypothetical protein